MTTRPRPVDYEILTARCNICNKAIWSIYPKQFLHLKKQHALTHEEDVTWQSPNVKPEQEETNGASTNP